MKKKIVVIGSNISECSKELYEFCFSLGYELAKNNFIIINGGKNGVMEAVFEGAKSNNNINSLNIGIIPENDIENANQFCDIVLPTGLGFSRNFILVSSAHTIIACGGGAGTLSEIAFAWQLGKRIIALKGYGGWSEKLAGTRLDNRREYLIEDFNNIEKLNFLLSN